MKNCLFCDFATKKIKKDFVLETEKIMVFPDIKPVAAVHLLVVPKQHFDEFVKIEEADSEIWLAIKKVLLALIKKYKLENKGYRIVINGGGTQLINHLHVHLTGGVSLYDRC